MCSKFERKVARFIIIKRREILRLCRAMLTVEYAMIDYRYMLCSQETLLKLCLSRLKAIMQGRLFDYRMMKSTLVLFLTVEQRNVSFALSLMLRCCSLTYRLGNCIV